MRWQSIAIDWEYFKPKVKRHWTALSDQQLESINGSYERLVQCLEESYGLSMEVVKDDIREWCFSFGEEQVREEELRTPLDELCEAPPALTAPA
jgi:uncharacterized protein YjbJ (UPF0337 family)